MLCVEVRRRQHHRGAVVQTIHNRNHYSVTMEQWIIYTNATVGFVKLLPFSWKKGKLSSAALLPLTGAFTHIISAVDQTEMTHSRGLWFSSRSARVLNVEA